MLTETERSSVFNRIDKRIGLGLAVCSSAVSFDFTGAPNGPKCKLNKILPICRLLAE